LRRHFADTARAAAGVSRQAPAGRFRFQGHRGPLPEALALTARTLDSLLGDGGRPSSWDDVTYALKATGRVPLDTPDREFLGHLAGQYPVFG
jgi:hypothetical protein